MNNHSPFYEQTQPQKEEVRRRLEERYGHRLLVRFAFFGAMALEPGEAERHLGKCFHVEQIAGNTNLS